MVSFYFLLLIPLITALRRFDEPDQYNVFRGNKPILRMAENGDDSELRSGSFRPHKKHYLNKKQQHQLRTLKAILGEDNADYSRGKTFDEPRKESKSSESSSSSSSSESDSPSARGLIKSFIKWMMGAQGNETAVPKKETCLRHSHFEVTSESPAWKENLWLMIVGKEKYPKHGFARSLEVYKGYKKNGRLVLLRKAHKDIDLSELKHGKLVLPRANKDFDLSVLNPDIIYYQ